MIEEKLITIGEAARILRISIDTLRRWNKTGKLVPIKISSAGYRLYSKSQIELFLNDLFATAMKWVLENIEIQSQFYCSNSAIFQAKLTQMQDLLMTNSKKLPDIFALITAIAGEIGNNSFDHNLGNWPDTPGIFFAYDIHKKIIVIADRGLGVLATLKRVRPELKDDAMAIKVAFTEIVSGRSPENRGNGLKFVNKIVSENPIDLIFKTGDAELTLTKNNKNLNIHLSSKPFRGCLALITF